MFSFPSIRRKNFVLPDLLIYCILAPTGMHPEVRPQLAFFEWSFGSKARNLKDRTTLRKGLPRFVENWTCFREMTGMLQALQLQTYKSLEVFIDGDSLGGDKVDITKGFSEVQRPQWVPYEKMKLLVFRCEFPQYLTFEDASSSSTDTKLHKLKKINPEFLSTPINPF